jgi:hypothetical protein
MLQDLIAELMPPYLRLGAYAHNGLEVCFPNKINALYVDEQDKWRALDTIPTFSIVSFVKTTRCMVYVKNIHYIRYKTQFLHRFWVHLQETISVEKFKFSPCRKLEDLLYTVLELTFVTIFSFFEANAQYLCASNSLASCVACIEQ